MSETLTPASVEQVVVRPTTADDLLSMYEEETATKADDVSKEVEKQAKVAQELPKKLVSDQLVKSLEQKPDEISEPEVETEELQEQPEQEQQKEAQKDETPKVKAKLGDQDVDIPEQAVIERKIGKKTVQFQVKDAIDAFMQKEVFNREMDTRVQRVSAKERQLQESYNEIKRKSGAIANLAKKGEWIPTIKALAKLAVGNTGLDPVEFEKACLDSLNQTYQVYQKMTPEQREVYFAKRQAEAATEEANKLKQVTSQQQAIQEVEQEIAQIEAQHGISKQRFYQLYKNLVDNQVGEGGKFKTVEEIEPKDVVQFHQDIQHIGRITEAAEKVSPALAEDDEFCREVFKLTKDHPDFTVDDFEQIIRDALKQPSRSVENLNRKVATADSNSLRTQLNQGSSKTGKNDVDSELEEFFFNTGKRSQQLAAINRR